MNVILKNAFAAFLVLGATSTTFAVAMSNEMTVLSGFPINSIFAKEIIVPFTESVEEATDGEITFNLSGPDAVPSFEQLEPVQAGLFDVLFTHPVWHAGTTGVGLSIDGTLPDPEKRRTTGVVEFIDSEYTKLGMKLVAVVPLGSKGFQFVLREPLNASPALQGLKLRASSSYEPLIKEFGGSMVILPQSEIYSGLQRGVFDGAGWGLVGVADMKLFEVADYLSEPTFGQASLMIFFNLDRWNSLSEGQKSEIEAVAKRIEKEAAEKFDDLAAQEKSQLLDMGMKITQFPQDDAERLDQLMSDAVWAVGMDRSPEAVKQLREIARDGGLTD